MNFSNKKLRDVQRLVHLTAASLLAIQLYSPLGENAVFTATVRFVIIPLAVLSGLVMWQMPRITKLLKGGSAA